MKNWCRCVVMGVVFVAGAVTAGERRLEPVRLQLKWTHGFQFAGYYAAAEKGFYRDAGLDVELVEGQPGMDFIEEVISGNSEYGVDLPVLALRYLQGDPVVVLAAIFQHSPEVLLALPDSGVRAPQGLIHKKVMIRQGSDAAVMAMFREEGIDSQDVTWVDHSWQLDDLIEGRVDGMTGYLTDEPFRLQQVGVSPRIINPMTYGVDFYGDCLFTSSQELKAHPKRVQAFREASLLGWRYALRNPEKMVELILEKYPSGRSRESLQFEAEKMQEIILPQFIEIGHMNAGRWEHIAETYRECGLYSGDIELDGFLYSLSEAGVESWPQWILSVISVGMFLVFVALAVLSLFNWRLKGVVSQRTEAYSHANEALLEEIAERSSVESALRDSEERMMMVIEGADIGTWDWNIQTGVVTYNENWAKMLGHELDELTPDLNTWESRVHPEDMIDFKKMLQAHFDGETDGFETEIRVRHKNGHWVWILDRGKVLERAEDGQPLRACGTHLDISHRKKTDDALHALIDVGSSKIGQGFFAQMAKDLNRILGADYTLVAEPTYRERSIQTLVVCAGDEVVDNFLYELAGTPCENVLNSGACCYESGVAGLFPEDKLLKKMGISGYVGVPLFDTQGTHLGLMAALFKGPMADSAFVASILQVFSGRVGAEIERCRAEEKLEQISRFPEENPNVVMRVMEDRTISYANDSSRSLLAYWGKKVGEEFPASLWAQHQSVLESGQPLDEELSCGDRVYMLSFVPVLSEKYVDIYGRDITERKVAEMERERLSLAIEQAAETIVVTDPNGVVQYVNPAVEKITGYARDEVIGHSMNLLQSGTQTRTFYREMWAALRAGEIWSGRFVNRKKDGSLYTEEATISPVHDSEGKIIHYVGAKQDITHEIELENQLRQSQKMEAVGQMAGGIAHDFNNLLQVICGYVELLGLDLDETSSLALPLGEIGKAADRGKTLVSQLLAFSRRQVIHPLDLNLNEVIVPLENMIGGVIGEKIKLNFDLSEHLNWVHVDRGMMEQVLMNICVNGRDAMLNGGTLTIRTENVVPDEAFLEANPWAGGKEFVRLVVSDTGTGIDPGFIGHIFEPFFTTKAVGKGTGLGLSMVYGLITQHHGKIFAESEPGKGTSFIIYLPSFKLEERDERTS